MAELGEAVAEIARLHDMYREQGLEIDRLAATQNGPLKVNVEAISDLIPDSFSERVFQEICFLVRFI